VSITQKLASGERKLVAIEIKGGTDASNIWNRLGAEKSHQSARKAGFNDLWTVTGVDVDSNPARQTTAFEKSPSTTEFFFLPRIVDQTSEEGKRFRQFLGSIMGVQLDN
jgi:XcyI restriction endonuclease